MIDTKDCWLWAGWKNKWGYGFISMKIGGKYAGRPAHRVIYEALVGDIPLGLELDHLCMQPPCVNPAHLEPVTRQENRKRQIKAAGGIQASTHCKHGHAWTAENTHIDPKGYRVCRACRYEQQKRYRAEKPGYRARYMREWRARRKS